MILLNRRYKNLKINLIKNKINKIKNKIKEEKINIQEGFFYLKDYISPSYINNTNPRYIEIDNIYYSSLLIVNYYREYSELILKNIINTNINMNISCFYEKQDTYKTIRNLTYHIGNVGVDLEKIKDNRQDADIALFTYNDAKYIRREMQVNNEELYYLYIYLTIYSKDLKEIEYLLNKVEGILQSTGIQTRRANFRQEQALLSTMPLMENHIDIKTASQKNILTSRNNKHISIYISINI